MCEVECILEDGRERENGIYVPHNDYWPPSKDRTVKCSPRV